MNNASRKFKPGDMLKRINNGGLWYFQYKILEILLYEYKILRGDNYILTFTHKKVEEEFDFLTDDDKIRLL